MGIARFTGRNHFLSDVLVGSALGYGIGRYVYKTYHNPSLYALGGDTSKRSKLLHNGRARLYVATLT